MAKEHEVGDFLYTYTKDNKESSVYLGFIGNIGKTNSVDDLYIRVVSIPKSKGTAEKLTESEMSYTADYDNCLKGSDIKASPSKEIDDIAKSISAKISCGLKNPQMIKSFFEGKKLDHLRYLAPADINLFGTNVKVTGYAGVYDADLSQMSKVVRGNYENAIKDYETIKGSFSEERYPQNYPQTLGEQALKNTIELSYSLGQKSTASQLCKEFFENYGYSATTKCNDNYLLSNTQISDRSVVINGKTHIIAFEGVREPSPEEFSLEIFVSYPGKTTERHQLSKNEILYLSDSTGEYIQLTGLEEDSATLMTNLKTSSPRGGTEPKQTQQKLKEEVVETFGSSYSFSIKQINLQKIAKVTINPQVDYARTNTTINFKIGIEKRAIQLSPEKTKERIETLNKTIEKWTKISNGLGKVVEAGKAACLVTAGALTIKNFFSNIGGKGIARQTVMKASGVGWYDKCREMVKPKGQYENVDACLFANSKEIDASVNAYETAMKQQNQEIKKLEEGISGTRFLGEKVVDTEKLVKEFVNDPLRNEVQKNVGGVITEITVGSEKININEEIIPYININTTTISPARSLLLNSRLLDSSDPNVQAIAKSNIEKTLGEIYSNSKAEAEMKTLAEETGLPSIIGSGKKLTEFPVTDVGTVGGSNYKDKLIGIDPKTLALTYKDQANNQKYLLILDKDYVITKTYSIDSKGGLSVVGDLTNVNPLGIALKKYDSKSYQNTYVNPLVHYFETDPYKGFPSVIPFDTKNGWYAAVKSNAPLLGGLQAYDASARVSSFYVCNVGQNGREENIGGDDVCRGFFPEADQPPNFPGLDEKESKNKMNQAVQAIQQAQTQYKTGVAWININGKRIDVGEPAANIPTIQCQDFMSPSDCNIMFNVCDPFICPSSRCNLGGAYPVKDVIQSGIAGSIALCLPNWPEVKVP
ncbi:MAG: hypothetical protein AAB922_04255, partial [Patescibacteria group bacterium]